MDITAQVWGRGFGLCTTRDVTLSHFGLAIDLSLESHDRDERFTLLCTCFDCDPAELDVLRGSNSSEVSPKFGVSVLDSAPPATVLWTIKD